MDIQGLYAVAVVSDIQASEEFYTGMLGRAPDDRPMDDLVQWRGIGTAGIQLVQDPTKAGKSLITIVVPDMDVARHRLGDAGIRLGNDIHGDFGVIAQADDPDGNRITFAEPPRGFTE